MIPKYISNNFNVLKEAFSNDDVCIMEVKDTKTGKNEYLICIHQTNNEAKDGKTEEFKPIARVFKFTKDDNPYTLYQPPLQDEYADRLQK